MKAAIPRQSLEPTMAEMDYRKAERNVKRLLKALERAFPTDGSLMLYANGNALYLHRRVEGGRSAHPEDGGEQIAAFDIASDGGGDR